MRRVREITAKEENFRLENGGIPGIAFIRKDPVEPEPVGTIILVPMMVVGYDPDCDGSLMARLYQLSLDDSGEPDPEILSCDYENARAYGVLTNRGLYPNSGIVVSLEELQQFNKELD